MAILVDEITQGLRNAIERRDPDSIARFAMLISARFAPREEAMSVSDGATKGDLAVVSDRLSELIGVVREGFAQMERRFEEVNRRFYDMNKRFTQLMWWTGILFGSLHVVLAIYGFGG
jgi:hypothetical protein